MTTLIGGVLRFRLLVLAAALGVLAVGLVQLHRAPTDVLPEFTPPYAEIQTEALGLSAQEVEQLITVPLEADLLNGVEGVEVIRSESLPGLSSIVLVFRPDADVYRARQLVEERLTQAHALPNVSKPPTLLQPLSSANRVLMIGLSSTELTPIEQSVIARWTVRPRLMGVPGVANVAVWGLRDQQLQVQVDPDQLRQRKVTLGQVITTAGNAQVVSPLSFLEASTPGTGGFVETPQQRLQVRHLLDKIADPAELAKVPVEGTGGKLKLGDVSTIAVDHQPLIGDAVVDGGPGLVLVVEKFPGASTPEVTAAVESALETLRPGLTGIKTDTNLLRPADYLAAAKDNLGLALGVGAGLGLLALVALWRRWRAVLVVVATVPLAVVGASLVLLLTGQGLNALVVAGLAAAVAVVVDDAVASTTQVLERARGDRAASAAHAHVPGSVVRDASTAARRPLLTCMLIAALAIVPVAVLQGRPGAFLSPLVTAYLLAVVASTLVALTVAPALTSLLVARWTPRAGSETPRRSRLRGRYESALGRFSATSRPLLLAAGAAAVVALAILPFTSTALLPRFADPGVAVRLTGQPGLSAAAMTEKTSEVTRALKTLPGVQSTVGSVGRAVTGDRVVNVNSAEVWVTLGPDADQEETLALIEETVSGLGDVTGEVVTSSSETMRAVGALRSGTNDVTGRSLDVLTGANHPLAVRMYGQDPAVLALQAERVRGLMAGVDGLSDPVVDQPATEPTIEIEVDLEKAQQVGITPGAVRRAEATLLQGIQVGSVFQEQKVFDVVVQGAPGTRENVADIQDMLIDRPGGGHVRLGDVADVRVVSTPSVISRDAVSRRLDVVAGVDGRSAVDVAADLRTQIAAMDFPLEYHAEVLTPSTRDEMGLGLVVVAAVGAAIAVLLLLQSAFYSWRLALLGMAALALSLTGGLVSSLVTGRVLTLGSLLGFLAVLGLAARMVVSMVQALQGGGGVRGSTSGAELASTAARRSGPVAASGLVLALLALPVVVLGPRAGLELLFPLAVVLLGGLVTTVLVSMFWVPAAYRQVASRSRRLPAEDDRSGADRHSEGWSPDDPGNGRHQPVDQPSSSATASRFSS